MTEPDHYGDCYPTVIEDLTFNICTEALCDDRTGSFSGQWRAWSFFAYDRSLTIFPADAVPHGLEVTESIAGNVGDTENEARRAVENTLRRVIHTRKLDGTGFYSPPVGLIYPQEFPDPDRR